MNLQKWSLPQRSTYTYKHSVWNLKHEGSNLPLIDVKFNIPGYYSQCPNQCFSRSVESCYYYKEWSRQCVRFIACKSCIRNKHWIWIICKCHYWSWRVESIANKSVRQNKEVKLRQLYENITPTNVFIYYLFNSWRFETIFTLLPRRYQRWAPLIWYLLEYLRITHKTDSLHQKLRENKIQM